MNNSKSLSRQECDKSIFIVESKIDDNIYKIKGCDGTLLEYVSDEPLLSNEVICLSMKEYNETLSISRRSATVTKSKIAEENRTSVPSIKEIVNTVSTINDESPVTNQLEIMSSLPPKKSAVPQRKDSLTVDLSSSRHSNIITKEKEKEPIIRKTEEEKEKPVAKDKLIKNNAQQKEKKSLLVDSEQDKIVLRYLRECSNLDPKDAVKYLLEANKLQSLFALYELFHDSRNGGDFGVSEFTDKFIASIIDRIPKRHVFQGIRKIMEADLLNKGNVPYLDDIRKRGWRAYCIISSKI